MMGGLLPLDAIPCDDEYCLYSAAKGLISGHITVVSAIKSFALVATGDPNTDARIYKREAEGWREL